jgi:hypothetical protein
LTGPEKERACENLHDFSVGILFFCVFGSRLATPGQAEEFYAYKDPHGNLVISNKLPPTGSIVLKRYELPQATDPQVQQPHEGGDTQLNGPSEAQRSRPRTNKFEVHGVITMQPELALKAISYTVIGIFLVTLLFVLLISLRKELSGDAPVRGVFQFGLAIIGLCTVVAPMAAYFQAKKLVLPHSNAQRLDTTSVSQPARPT